MHIGDGDSTLVEFTNGEERVTAEVQTVAKTVDERVRIPGTALKGVLRRYCSQDGDLTRELFGEINSGGLVQFLDAESQTSAVIGNGVLRRTAIDEVSGTAKKHMLFAKQLVPAGTTFNVRIRGKSYASDAWKEHVGYLLAALGQSSAEGIQFGASEANGKGRCNWTLGAVHVMDSAALSSWLMSPKPVDAALGELPDRQNEITVPEATARPGIHKSISVSLNFQQHHFLVNDPTKVRPREGEDTPGHAHVARRKDGKLELPEESLRGVLAHQAAKIARTCGKRGDRENILWVDDGMPSKDIGCVTRLFGGPGWKTILKISDFVEVSREESPGLDQSHKEQTTNSFVQQFVAVDRFTTTGGPDGAKFDAEGGWQPCIQGKITLDMTRLGLLGNPSPSLGLLALTLRDLAEGDLTFGWGAGKGYGWATIEPDEAVQWVEKVMAGLAPGSVKDWVKAWEEEGN
jgi:hypothetical protein